MTTTWANLSRTAYESFLLQELGDFLLQENGDRIELEDNIDWSTATKSGASWSNQTKN